ncbi:MULTISPECIES: hypothetical protein [Parafrankia]|nr:MULTISPECIES: hypothetical protein [Parafrankia]MBE3201631.1 hypothetical protein [Parafrankia sp. CH37]
MDQSRRESIKLEKQALSAGSGRDSDRARLGFLTMEEGSLESRAKLMERATTLQAQAGSGADAGERAVGQVLKTPGAGVPGLGSESADLRAAAGLLPAVGVGPSLGIGLDGGGGRKGSPRGNEPSGPNGDQPGDPDGTSEDDGLNAVFGPTGYSQVRDPLGSQEQADDKGFDAATNAVGRQTSLPALPDEVVASLVGIVGRTLGNAGLDLPAPGRLPAVDPFNPAGTGRRV